jgi:S-methylmethionine-dependent homocysteine/selenocysteine methylase
LRSGETIAEAARALDGLGVSGFLANCCAPESITAAMPALAAFAALGQSVAGGYANGFRGIPTGWSSAESGIEALGTRDDLGPDSYVGHVESWIDRGARVVGGCCEIGPAHIAEIRDRLAARQP